MQRGGTLQVNLIDSPMLDCWMVMQMSLDAAVKFWISSCLFEKERLIERGRVFMRGCVCVGG